jgi:nucleotide-binding universal stress UspA family protein
VIEEAFMPSIKHILFPIDFSDRCCDASRHVRAMAARFGAKITLINAVPPFWQAGLGDGSASMVVDLDELKRNVESRLNDALVQQFDRIPVARIVEIGDPAAVITEFAHSHDVDLIMMPTHGYGPFRTLLVGSVTAKVLHDALCPVWTAAHIEKSSPRKPEAGNLLCAIDGSPNSIPLVKWAAEYAQSTGAKLRLVHAVSGFVGWPEQRLDRDLEENLRTDSRKAIEQLLNSTGVTAPLCVGVGEVAAVVRAEAERHDSDLILIGRGIMHKTLGRLRTHSYDIIRHAPCPVLSI